MSKGAPDYTECTEIKGFDGSNLKTVKVDTDGQLYALMRGIYGSTFKTLAVDENGQLYAILKAVYNSTPTPLKCDVNGNLLLNIKAQDIAFITSRPYYGDGQSVLYKYQVLSPGKYVEIGITEGKGRIFSFNLYCRNQPASVIRIKMFIDGVLSFYGYLDEIWSRYSNSMIASPLAFHLYDAVNDRYGFYINSEIQFESSFSVDLENFGTGDIYWDAVCIYALA